MRIQTIIFSLLIGSLFAAGCETKIDSPASSAPTEEMFARATDSMMAQARRFSAAVVAGDIESILAIYTDDAVIFPGRSEYLEGKEKLREYWAPRENRQITFHEITPIGVDIDGDLASDFGHYTASGIRDGEAWGPSSGKYLVVWKRGDDGRWRMLRDMWNSRPPPPE